MSDDMDDVPEEFQHLQRDYGSLRYPGDLPGDLGLIASRPSQRAGWRVGAATRWLGPMAAAAAVALVVGGIWNAMPSPSPVAVTPPATRPSAVTVTSPKIFGNAVAVASATSARTTAATTLDDSIPLWSDVDVSADVSSSPLSASAGLPSQSLILPTISEVQGEKTQADQVKTSQSRS